MKYANITKCKKNDKGVHHCRPLPLIKQEKINMKIQEIDYTLCH